MQGNRIFMLCMGVIFSLFSCSDNGATNGQVEQIVQYWKGRILKFPSQSVFTMYGKDPVDFPEENVWDGYKVVSYVDSTGCMSCKLQLYKWKEFISRIGDVPVLFYMFPKHREEVERFLEKCIFDYPICIDMQDSLNKLNHFSSIMEYQTFLLDKDDKVVAIGNPVLNYRVRDIYLNVIQGMSVYRNVEEERSVTTVDWSVRRQTMGNFNWQEEQSITFTCKNTGRNPLVIRDVVPSCSCLNVNYPKGYVLPGKETLLQVTYKADNPGSFYKSISVYCNAGEAPIRLYVSGNALDE